ncbi:MAG TPA: glycosyltransferase [Solirubrobacterales bacterium]|jgi:glycosyltransferase involved in cell wall biosynthesis|nr:glycosyltransferase [Solirubrobacterales bacterium]
MPPPFFSIVVPTYNRERIIGRCVESCLGQSCGDFELIVVDDHSSDGTVAKLETYEDPRLRILVHDHNRGITPSRNTGVLEAAGEWVVIVDSDWELLPGALERLREIVAGLPPGVRVVRSRLRWDDGGVTPRFTPAEPVGYEGRIRWAEAEGGHDAAHCMHRSVFERTPLFADRRGAMETLYELELANHETTLYVDDVIGVEHTDAPNSWLRSVAASELVPRLFSEAPDMLWMAETTLRRHGAALRDAGPRQYATMLRVAAVHAFLLGKRGKGTRYALAALRRRPFEPMAWVTLVLGLLGPRPVARGTLAFRRLAAWRKRPRSAGAGGAEAVPVA